MVNLDDAQISITREEAKRYAKSYMCKYFIGQQGWWRTGRTITGNMQKVVWLKSEVDKVYYS